MNKLEAKHIEFLRTAAGTPNKTHTSDDIPDEELRQMAEEGLLIQYNGIVNRYAISRAGASVAQSYGASLEIIKLAKEALKRHKYSDEEADAIIKEHGAEEVLKSISQSAPMGQNEVKIPTDENGRPTMKFHKP